MNKAHLKMNSYTNNKSEEDTSSRGEQRIYDRIIFTNDSNNCYSIYRDLVESKKVYILEHFNLIYKCFYNVIFK